MRLVCYCRTSAATNGNGDSLVAQEQACRDWAHANGHEVTGVHADDGISGALGADQRPGLAAALLALEDGAADGLVVHRPDRLARALHVQEAVLLRAWQAGDHVAVFEAAEGDEIRRDDPDDPYRTFVRQVMGAAAQLERSLVTRRMQDGRRRKAAAGGYAGGERLHPKYGYTLENGEYKPVPEQLAVIARIKQLRAEGRSLRAVAAVLTDEGIAPPSSARWHAQSVKLLAAR